MRTPRVAYAAYVKERATVAVRPGGKTLLDLGPETQNGFPTVLGVLAALVDSDCEPTWYDVQLAKRPNGSTGYVPADDVVLRRIDVRIEIDLSERRLELIRDGERLFETTAAIGSDITPTPTGQYFVNERWIVNDSWGAFGPRALGISAYSPVLEDWVQGGPIGIHGTNEPASVGQAASHGCIRLKNEAMLLLFSQTPAGTPVDIRA